MSELLYAGKSLSEIAGYNDLQLAYVVCRRRDSMGRLQGVREDLPPGVDVDEDGMRVVRDPVAFSEMYWQVRRCQGLNEPLIERDWCRYLAENPKLGEY